MTQRPPKLVLMILILGAGAPALAGGAAAPWTVDDVVRLEQAGGFQISPDGKWTVWERTRPDLEKNRRVTELFLSSLDDGSEIQLTRGGEGDGSPRWSPDGKLIAFRSSRRQGAGPEQDDGEDDEGDDEEDGDDDGRTAQIWLINPRGGEPWRLTSLDKGIESFAWLDDGTLAFTAREATSLRERTLRKRKDDAVVVEDERHFMATRLFTVDVSSREVRRRTGNDDQIAEFAPSPDGRWVVARHHASAHYEADARPRPRFFLYDLHGTGIVPGREIFDDPLFYPYGFVWAREGSGFFCLRTRTSDPASNGAGVETLFWFDLGAGRPREVPLDWPNGVGGVVGYDVTVDGFLALLADGPSNRLARYTRRGDSYTREFVDDPRAGGIDSFKVGPDGATVVFSQSTASTPRRTFAGRLAAGRIESQRAIAQVNDTLATKRMARAVVTRWKGARGDDVDGILFYPPDYQEGKRYPLVLMIHGGPNDVDLDSFDESWAYAAHMVAGKGAFVLKPNYHGSTNHGQEFAESIKQHYYEYEIPDILDGIDALAGRGLIDPQRLGVIGWSNGAILTWELITRTDRFRAAVPGAGDVNWTSDYGNCSFGAWFDNYYMGGPPWEKARTYIEKSPYFRLAAVRTPTLIFFGTEDRAVDAGQGWEAYRALQQIGRAPVRFVLFPGEPHSLAKPSHQRRKLEEEAAWLDRYLFSGDEPHNEALKEGSPLDLALKARQARRDGGLLGLRRDGLLVPETVPWPEAPDGIVEVGRFEVTRAQYAAFDSSYGVTEATANLPASGIGFDKATAYCDWLSARTGEGFRLPTISESRALLARTAGDPLGEVTLDYWAGFALNPDEARKLEPAIEGLPGDGPLLRPVGSALPTPITPTSLVYDLAGNVSEWVVDPNGGRAVGCNASQPCDKMSAGAEPRAAYVGLRVIRTIDHNQDK